MDQSQAQNTSLDSATAYKSKQQLKSNLKSSYESKTGYKVMDWIKKTLDPNQVQNTSLDSVTAYKSKLQPKSNLKSDSKSWIGSKILEKLIKNPKVDQNQVQKYQHGLGIWLKT